MPDENGTEATRQDAVSVEESIFGDTAEKADDTPAEVVEEREAEEKAEQEPQVSEDTEEAADAEAEDAPSDELKVVVSIKGGRAVIGVQQPSADPHIETFEGHDLPALAQEVVGGGRAGQGEVGGGSQASRLRAARSPAQAPQQPAPAGGGDERQRRGRGGAGGCAADAEAVLGQAA